MTRILPALCAFAAFAVPSFADSLRDQAVEICNARQASVVSLSALTKTSLSADGDAPPQLQAALSSQDKEQKAEMIGTVIDPSGLIVTALIGLDPAATLDGMTMNTKAGTIKLKARSETKDIKVLTSDGTEIPADLVLKDSDLGLAFIRIRTDSKEANGMKFEAVDLSDSADAQLLDECVALGRLDESLDREIRVLTGSISSVIKTPRTRYLAAIDQLVGGPVFLGNGKLLGISILHRLKDTDDSMQPNKKLQLIPVILPAKDVAKIAAQAVGNAPAGNP